MLVVAGENYPDLQSLAKEMSLEDGLLVDSIMPHPASSVRSDLMTFEAKPTDDLSATIPIKLASSSSSSQSWPV